MIFGHGSWSTSPSLVEHITSVEGINVPTIDLVRQLHDEGATYIWGTWCYANDFDGIIRIDKVFGVKEYWPSYVSRPKGKGKTLPIWIGPWFVRLNDNKPQGVDTSAFDFNQRLRVALDTPEEEWYSKDSIYKIGNEDKARLGNEIYRMYGFQPDSLHLNESQYPILRVTREEVLMIQNHEMLDHNKFLFTDGFCWLMGKKISLLVPIPPVWPPIPGHGPTF